MIVDKTRQLAEAMKKDLAENNGGHSLTNLNGDMIWHCKLPVNLTWLAETAVAVLSSPPQKQSAQE